MSLFWGVTRLKTIVQQVSVVLNAGNIGGPVIKERHKIREDFEGPMSPSVHLFQLQLDRIFRKRGFN